jgi:hypothetical protein
MQRPKVRDDRRITSVLEERAFGRRRDDCALRSQLANEFVQRCGVMSAGAARRIRIKVFRLSMDWRDRASSATANAACDTSMTGSSMSCAVRA